MFLQYGREANDPPAGLAAWDDVPAGSNLNAILIVLKDHESRYAVGREDNLRVQDLIGIVLDIFAELGVGGDDPNAASVGSQGGPRRGKGRSAS